MRSKNPVKDGKTDAKVLVHQAFIVDLLMVDIVAKACLQKPHPNDWNATHPKISNMHSVMNIAEGDEAPGKREHNKCNLKSELDVQEIQHENAGQQQEPARYEPFQSHVSQGGPVTGCIKISTLWPLFRERAIKQQMVFHVTSAENANLVGMQQPVKQIAQEFGDQAGANRP